MSGHTFRSFEDARNYIRSLKLTGYENWREYSKSGKRPADIPSHPDRIYKKEWKGYVDWLGSEGRPSQFLPFAEAREIVHKIGLKSVKKWREYLRSGKKPENIPAAPNTAYKDEWKGYPDWLGNKGKRGRYTEFLPFIEARKIVRELKFKNLLEFRHYARDGKLPVNIPNVPHNTYKYEWKGYPDFLGNVIVNSQYGKFREFEDARKFVHSLKIRGSKGWHDYCSSGKKPDDIPSHPDKTYKKEWKGWSDWNGIDAVKVKFSKLRPFSDAREFIHSLNFKNTVEWQEYCKSGKKPKDIPSTPNMVYKDEWKGMADWLGYTTVHRGTRKLRTFVESRDFVHKLGLKTSREWLEYCKSGKKPHDIPSYPNLPYSDEWKGMGDWLGTFSIAKQNKQFRKFEDARNFVHSLNLASSEEWSEYKKSGKKPHDIPSSPHIVYEKEWKGIGDWLGYEDTRWSVNKVKELLRDLIKSGTIYQWNEAVLYSLLLRKGLLNLGSNRHARFLRDLIIASKTSEGRLAIEDYANADYEVPPDLSQLSAINNETADELELQTASSEELTDLIDETNPLEYGDVEPVENILRHTDFLESINVDEEAMRFYVNYSINQLWKNAFRNEDETISKVRKEGKNGNKYHDEVVETFLSDYESAKNLVIPQTYSFPKPPVLMQRYVSYKLTEESSFGNFSSTGAGKTLSAVLASRIVDSKLTLIVCPNEVVEHWENHISEIFPDSKIITGKKAFFVKADGKIHQYAILNYDKFNQPDSTDLILNLGNQKIDFVVLDEIHFSKIRDQNVSLRRKNLDGLMTMIRRVNKDVKVLGISATPIVNNLQEGRSLLELITGKIYNDVATRPTIPNAVTLYEKLSNISIREIPEYPISIDTNILEVEAPRPDNITIKHLKSNPLTIEQILTDSRLPEIIRLIEGQTIIYTEYVEQIIQKLSQAVRDAGYSFALYTGTDHSGLKRFLAKKIQVLIASRPISTGIDGLQEICNRLIINTLPWTNAQYQQLLGRLVRRGQIKDVVHVYVVKASIAGYPYDQLKLNRIKFKRTLADCAVDGILPEKNLVTPDQANAEAIKWLERLERGEISTITRGDLNVELTPVQVEQRIKKYGDFERFNQRINIEKSETTHLRLIENPEEWLEYHRQYREARKNWAIIPYQEWIKRLKILSTRLLIGDFGCGEAMIREEVGDRVHSFDHVAINDNVTACDISSVPLEEGSLDVVVFSLSIMGKNWSDYIKEARRCLATNGYLFISETTNALQGRLSSLRDVLRQEGFEIYEDNELGNFTFIESRKL
jgi:superfamily II DNA or RNA helicase